MRGRPRSRGEGGNTLIELMICVAIIGIMVAGGAGAMSAQQRAGARASYLIRATGAMEAELERLRSMDLLPGSGAFSNAELLLVPGAKGERMVRRSADGLATVRVRVLWQTPNGQKREAELLTLLWAGMRSTPSPAGEAAPGGAP